MLLCAQHIPKTTILDFILHISLYLCPSIALPNSSPAFFTLRVSQTNIIFTHAHLHSSTSFWKVCESRNPTDLDGHQGHRDECSEEGINVLRETYVLKKEEEKVLNTAEGLFNAVGTV